MNRFALLTVSFLLPFLVPFLAVTLSSLSPAFASAVLLTDMNAMECKVFEDPAFWRCDIWYENARVFAGRDVGPDYANGDCVICRNVRTHAQKNQLNIILNRDSNWDDQNFLMYTTDDTLNAIYR